MKQRNEDGMVYRGACDLVHIADGERAIMGDKLAHELADMMRRDAVDNGSRTYAQVYGEPGQRAQDLCAGCYMVALFNAAVTLAKENGQSLSELGRSMSQAFASLAEGGEDRIESIHVALDPDDDTSDSIIAAGHAIALAAGVEDVTLWGTLAQHATQGGMVA